MHIGPLDKVFANDPGDRGSVPGRVIPKNKKNIVLDAILLSTQHYKGRINDGIFHRNRKRNVVSTQDIITKFLNE